MSLRTDQTDALSTLGNHAADHVATNTQVNANTTAITDLQASTTGTNTGDETLATIKSKLGVTTLSGSNTGDQTITLTGDVTGSGTGSFAATLPTVNSNVGSFTAANITVDGKGRVTAAANGSGGAAITVKDEGTTLTSAPTSMNFVGAGVTATQASNAVTVTIPDNSTTKEPAITSGTTAQYWRGDKSFQTLNQDAVPSGTTNKAYTATEQTKLAGIATGATANSTDATLLARANHTGTQLASTISDFSTAADARISAAAGVSVASLSGGKIPSSQIPAVALTSVQTAASQAAQLALTTQEGDVVVRSDTNQTYVRNAGVAGTMADFTLLATPTDAVTSVNGATGVVVLAKGDVGLGNVDNTSDATKQTANDSRYLQLTGGTLTGTLLSRTIAPTLNNSYGLGGSSFYWFSSYVATRYFNSASWMDGTVSGIVTVNGDLRMAAAGTNSASVATVGGTQTLTGKTIDGASNTFSNVPIGGIAATGTPSSTTYLRGDGTWSAASGGSGTPAGSSAQIQYNNAGAFGGTSALTWDNTNSRLAHGTAPSGASSTGMIVTNAAAFQMITGAIGTTAAAGVTGYHARGTTGSPTATQSGDNIGSYTGRGFGASTWSNGSNGGLFVRAEENMTETARGSRVSLEGTAPTTVTRTEIHRFTAASASAVNYLQSTNSVTTTPVILSAQGTDTNVGINLTPKGTGTVQAAGVDVTTVSGTQTLTNKRITKRIEALTDAATVTPASDTNDGGKVTELSQTSVFANPTGTPTDMQQYILRIKSTSARAISFGTAYRAIGLTLPTTTVAGKMLYIAMQWEAGASKWDVLYVGQEA